MAWTYAGAYGPVGLVDNKGNAQTGAEVEVYDIGTSTLATLWESRDKSTQADNPVDVDSNGNVTFFVDPGRYDAVVRRDGIKLYEYEIHIPPDPAEPHAELHEPGGSDTLSGTYTAMVNSTAYGLVGDDTADDTAALLSFLQDCAGRVGYLRKPSVAYKVDEISTDFDYTLIFEDGVEIRPTSGQAAGAKILDVAGGHVEWYCDGLTLRHDRAEYGANGSESDHCLSIGGTASLTAHGRLNLLNGGGDGIYIRTSGTVIAPDLLCDNNYRNGCSLVAWGAGTYIDGEFKNTNGTSPQKGIDIEPNSTDTWGDGLKVRGRTSGNAGGGCALAMTNASAQQKLDIDIDLISTDDDADGLALSWRNDHRGRLVARINATRPGARGLRMGGGLSSEMDVIADALVVDPDRSGSTLAREQTGVALYADARNLGNIDFTRIHVIDTRGNLDYLNAALFLQQTDTTNNKIEGVRIHDFRVDGVNQDNWVKELGGVEDLSISFPDRKELALTSDTDIAVDHLGYVITNEGAGSFVIHTLREDRPIGVKRYRFLVHAAQNVRLSSRTGIKILPGGVDGGYIESSDPGAFVELEYVPSLTAWSIVSEVGTWTRST